MVGGAVFCNPYATGQALIAWSIGEWRYFDGWATAAGINLYEVSCPRFMNLIFHFLTKDTTTDDRREFEQKLDELEQEIQQKIENAYAKEEQKELKTTDDKILIPSNNPWKAPPGWKPPGWMSDEENMANIQALMGTQIEGNKTIPK